LQEIEVSEQRILGAGQFAQAVERSALVRLAAIETKQELFQLPPGFWARNSFQQRPMIAVGMAEAVLPEAKIVGEVVRLSWISMASMTCRRIAPEPMLLSDHPSKARMRKEWSRRRGL
jgi:hypothetical protein